MGSILRDNLADVNCESKIAARQSGDGFAARHLDLLQGPLCLRFAFERTRTCAILETRQFRDFQKALETTTATKRRKI